MPTHDPKPPQNPETLGNIIESRQREKRVSWQKSDQELREYPEYRDFPPKLTEEWRQQKKKDWQKSGHRMFPDMAKLVLELSDPEAISEYNAVIEELHANWEQIAREQDEIKLDSIRKKASHILFSMKSPKEQH